jgi:8-oxo-dGTP diphosphatase
MKERKDKSRVPILAAGGIVLRNDSRPQFAIVRLRKPDSWGLPKGKLAAGEHAMAAARREVLEETGHRVTIHEFLGTLAYEASRRPKVVQFWRMQAVGEPIADLMRDVTAVDWLALEDAIERLTHLRERVFLEQVGPIALKLAERSARRAASKAQPANHSVSQRAASAPWLRTIASGVPLAPVADGNADERREWARPIEQELAKCGPFPAADAAVSVPAPQSAQMGEGEGTEAGVGQPLIEKTLVKKTWGWLRHAAMLRRQRLD